jgi:NAD dependent epimerase/dehydratase family enzyme
MVMFGRDLVRELMLASTRVHPRVLEDGGFAFTDPELGPALRAMVAGR